MIEKLIEERKELVKLLQIYRTYSLWIEARLVEIGKEIVEIQERVQ